MTNNTDKPMELRKWSVRLHDPLTDAWMVKESEANKKIDLAIQATREETVEEIRKAWLTENGNVYEHIKKLGGVLDSLTNKSEKKQH